MKAAKRILIIDDEAAIRKFLRVSLENEGYHVIEAATGKDAIREFTTARPDLAILDLGLPDMDGYDVLCKVREWSKVPVIVLTVKEDEDTKVKVLDAGADDYLTKPFGVPELLARIRSTWRRLDKLTDNTFIFKSGKLHVDLSARMVKVNEKEIHLTVTEYDILKLLIKHAGKVVTQRQILQEVWGPNSIEHTQYLRVYLGHLRKKIEIDTENEKLIVTEPGVGYRLLLV